MASYRLSDFYKYSTEPFQGMHWAKINVLKRQTEARERREALTVGLALLSDG